MLNRDWGVGIRIPSATRSFTTDIGTDTPDIQTYNVSTLGDIELTGMYTGLTNDMSKGLIFGSNCRPGTGLPPVSTATPKLAPAAPISFSAASGAA